VKVRELRKALMDLPDDAEVLLEVGRYDVNEDVSASLEVTVSSVSAAEARQGRLYISEGSILGYAGLEHIEDEVRGE